jgi:hypothetical protein
VAIRLTGYGFHLVWKNRAAADYSQSICISLIVLLQALPMVAANETFAEIAAMRKRVPVSEKTKLRTD